jgi:glutamyl-tRNA reductase
MEEARAERIRRCEVSRALAGMNLSPEKEEAVERLSRSLVGKLLRGPVALAGASVES